MNAAVMVELGPTRTEEPDMIEVIENIDVYTAAARTVPGCGDDNPYN
ncbi:hypothetical protein [Streptomyces blattellae]|nr:hypothetical protein [Streptomyces blattellae]